MFKGALQEKYTWLGSEKCNKSVVMVKIMQMSPKRTNRSNKAYTRGKS